MEKISKYQQLSLREAGQFDRKFLGASVVYEIGNNHCYLEGDRVITCGWTRVCKDRHLRGLSRKVRIARSKG